MAKRTTTVLDTWAALYDILRAVAWPAHPASARLAPVVVFGDDTKIYQEAVLVLGTLPERSTTDWATFGAPSQNERFSLWVRIGTKVPGTKREEAFARLRVLLGVLEETLRDQTSGRPAPASLRETVPGLLSWRVARIDPSLYPLEDGTGYGATADVDVAFTAYI